MHRFKFPFFAIVIALSASVRLASAAQPATTSYIIHPGDTWTALSLRYGIEAHELKLLNPQMNSLRQPAVGRPVNLPETLHEQKGRIIRPHDGGLVQSAAANLVSPWALADQNDLPSPYRPTLYRALLLAGTETIREYPFGLTSLEFSQSLAVPGAALGVRGMIDGDRTNPAGELLVWLDSIPAVIAIDGENFIGIAGTGAFYSGGEPEVVISAGNEPVWTQPLAFDQRDWIFQQLTLTGEAAEIDQQARDEERARLRELWTVVTGRPQWAAHFASPIMDFLEVSAPYGARRSYNGGPYLTYHEGVDFSAYAGTPVYAPAGGTVVLAEELYVRGGSVIIDHGLGIFTGYYHLSAVHAVAGQPVHSGDLLGEVGTTGLSTGNHLHWDMLVNGVWVDARLWQDQRLDCWLLEGLGRPCDLPSLDNS